MCNQRILPFIESVSKNAALNSLLNYRDPLGTHFQRATAAEWLQTQGVRTNAEEVAIVSGVQNGLAVTLAAAFSPGQRIAVDRYTYSNFIELAQLYHLEIVPIGYDSEGMDPEHLLQECKKKKIHGIFLMPACNNPIGFQMSSARRMTLAEIIQQEHLWVIEDDIHSFNNLCTASSFTNVSRTLTSTNDLLSGDDKVCLYRLTHCVPCFPSASSPRNRACDF